MPEFQDDDEIDLAELFATIWAHKGKVVGSTVAAVAVAGVYLTTLATPLYEAKARFELLDNSTSSPLGNLGSLASLAGVTVGSGGGEADTLEDRILSRPFIDQIYDDAEFGADPSFNPELSNPGLKTRLIRWVTGSKPEPMDRQDFIGAALEYLTEELSITVMANGLLEVGVTHKDAERAAVISNIIVDAAIADIHTRARYASREKLSYFAEQLSEVQSDLDLATRALSDYALNNDLRSQEDLARASTQLVALRQNASDVRERQAALAALKALGEPAFDPRGFAREFPVSIDVEFRRALGWGAAAATWSYPAAELLERAGVELQSSLEAVERNIEQVQGQATVTGEAAIVLAELQRNVEVQGAIYAAMIQQFEAQSFTTGFESASGRLIDPAVVPKEPSSPKKALVGALSIVLGGFVGIAIALVAGLRSGRIYMARGLQDAARRPTSVKLPAHFSKAIRFPKSSEFQRKVSNSVAVDQIVASMPDMASVIGLLPTSSGQASYALSIGAGLKLASIHGDALVLSLGPQGFDLTGFELADANLDRFEARRFGADLDWCQAGDAKLGEVEELITAAKVRYKAVVLISEPSTAGVLQAHRVARNADVVVVVGQAGLTTRDALSAAVTVAEAERPNNVILAAV